MEMNLVSFMSNLYQGLLILAVIEYVILPMEELKEEGRFAGKWKLNEYEYVPLGRVKLAVPGSD